jgi:RNA polymerase sigma factor (sigma-70 family)
MEELSRQLASLDLSRLEDDELLLLAKVDLSQVGDAQLARVVTESCCRPAARTLLLRHLPQMNRLIARKVHQAHLATVEVEDAQQNAAQAALEAIRRCALPGGNGSRRCQFKSFLYRVVLDRFHDTLRRDFRMRKRQDRSTNAGTRFEGDNRLLSRRDSGATDPARIVEESEVWACFDRALRDLDEEDRRFCAGLLTRRCLKEVAATLGISYATAKRWRARLLAKLRARLGSLSG